MNRNAIAEQVAKELNLQVFKGVNGVFNGQVEVCKRVWDALISARVELAEREQGRLPNQPSAMRERFEKWCDSQCIEPDSVLWNCWQAAQIPNKKIEEMARRVQDKIQQVTMPTTKEIAEVLRQAMEGK